MRVLEQSIRRQSSARLGISRTARGQNRGSNCRATLWPRRLSRFYPTSCAITAAAGISERRHRPCASRCASLASLQPTGAALLKFFAAFFGSDCGEQDQRQKNYERKESKRLCVVRMPVRITEMTGQAGFNNGCVGCE